MSDRRQTAEIPESDNRPKNDAVDNNSKGQHEKETQEFSWYGGRVDETVVREIVRLKREQKL